MTFATPRKSRRFWLWAPAALQRGGADVTITNATAEHMKPFDFTEPLVSLALGLLARAGGPLVDGTGMDQTGARISVSLGSSSQCALGPGAPGQRHRPRPWCGLPCQVGRAAERAGLRGTVPAGTR